jgi:microcystin-dependent protein
MSNVFLGQLVLFPWGWAPQGFAICEGQEMQISQNVALFSLLGTTFGGDGVKTFKLPDLREKSPEGTTWCIALLGNFPTRQ